MQEAPTGCHVHLANKNGPVAVVNLDVMGPSVWAVRGSDGSVNLVRWPEGMPVVQAARDGLMAIEPMVVEYVGGQDATAWTKPPGAARAVRTDTTCAPSPPGLAPDGRFLTHAAAEVQIVHGFPSGDAQATTVHVHTAPAEHRSVSRPLSVALDSVAADANDTADEPGAPGGSPAVVSLVRRQHGNGGAEASLETVDMGQRIVRSVPLQRGEGGGGGDGSGGEPQSDRYDVDEAYADDQAEVVDLCELGQATGKVATLQRNGLVRLWQLDNGSLGSELDAWKKMFGGKGFGQAEGQGEARLGSVDRITFRDKDGKSVPKTGLDRPKEGKHDEKNDPHVGGNTWAGGTGGSDTAGLGGRGGPHRLDKGHQVHQVPDAAKAEVSEEAQAMARAMAEEGLRKR